jgi:lipopolysaccharide transport system permease protein
MAAQDASSSLLGFIKQPWKYRELLWQLIKREVIGRYRGSVIGIFWSFLNPLFMLAVYTFFFSIVYQARWGINHHSKVAFAITLFAGLIPFTLFSECINRAPHLILNNVNYVKKVIFPLDILPWVSLGSALFHAMISLIVLLVFFIFINHTIHWTVIFLPIVILPLLFLIMGLSWFLASLGVFIRDVTHTVSLCTMALLFLSPVFYSISAIPEQYRIFIYLNPLTYIIEQTRTILILGESPNWFMLSISLLASISVAWLGDYWFTKTKHAFADVV